MSLTTTPRRTANIGIPEIGTILDRFVFFAGGEHTETVYFTIFGVKQDGVAQKYFFTSPLETLMQIFFKI